MQDRYFGDVGDFGKYGLLRILSGLEGEQLLKLGIVWYLFPDESHNADGKHISYLRDNDRSFRDCDEQLYEKLRDLLFDDLGLVESNRHTVTAEVPGLLPEGTVFFREPLAYAADLSVAARLTLRGEWFDEALIKTHSADLVFLDPDNGIECKSVKRTGSKGPKYVFWDEIEAFVDRGQSVVVYHHLNRSGAHAKQVEDKLIQMRERLGKGFESFAITFVRGSNRAYFVIASPHHKDLLRERLAKISSGPWKHHFR